MSLQDDIVELRFDSGWELYTFQACLELCNILNDTLDFVFDLRRLYFTHPYVLLNHSWSWLFALLLWSWFILLLFSNRRCSLSIPFLLIFWSPASLRIEIFFSLKIIFLIIIFLSFISFSFLRSSKLLSIEFTYISFAFSAFFLLLRYRLLISRISFSAAPQIRFLHLLHQSSRIYSSPFLILFIILLQFAIFLLFVVRIALLFPPLQELARRYDLLLLACVNHLSIGYSRLHPTVHLLIFFVTHRYWTLTLQINSQS